MFNVNFGQFQHEHFTGQCYFLPSPETLVTSSPTSFSIPVTGFIPHREGSASSSPLHLKGVPYLTGLSLFLAWPPSQVSGLLESLRIIFSHRKPPISLSWLSLRYLRKKAFGKESNNRDNTVLLLAFSYFAFHFYPASDTSLVLYLLSFHKSLLF